MNLPAELHAEFPVSAKTSPADKQETHHPAIAVEHCAEGGKITGSGLGLSFVRNITSLHKMKCKITAKEGIFAVTLKGRKPKTAAVPQSAAAESPPRNEKSGFARQNRRIL